MDITAVVDDLLHIAQATGIVIIPLRNGEWSNAREQGYQMYQIQLLISSNVDDVARFVDKVEATMLYSIKIDSLDMTGKSIGAAASVNGTGAVDGYITVAVYAR